MFTGIIQQVGKLAGKEKTGAAARLTIKAEGWNPPLALGESIAVNGVCLTVARLIDDGFSCDVLQETMRCTNLGAKKSGAMLNLERALRLADPMGGHLLSGHIDDTGTIVKRGAVGEDLQLDIACDNSILRYIVPKGSIACDGVSLTVAKLEKTFFSVNIIPFTERQTILGSLKKGDTVNLETDLIGKYVFRFLEQNKNIEPLTIEHLRRAGFIDGQ